MLCTQVAHSSINLRHGTTSDGSLENGVELPVMAIILLVTAL
jgi:hypothetical protein